jgi:aspartyl-tRNA(Asn)/glutamyl-tRNA(Gln) amidotransferase subunit C
MPVTIEDVRKVAYLARLRFSPEEEEKLIAQLNRILDYIGQLNELDTTDVEPTSHVLPLTNAFRDDNVNPSASRKELLSNAPSHDGKFFRVPKVI